MSFQLALFQLFGIRPGRQKKKTVRRRRSAREKQPRVSQEDPQLKELWLKLRQHYFPERKDLDTYFVRWSLRQQKRTLASCALEKRVITVAQEMSNAQCAIWLEPLLYHEMCHAVLGQDVGRQGGKRQWHGSDFRHLERQHPGIPALDHWIKSGGWRSAVRSHRAKKAFAARPRSTSPIPSTEPKKTSQGYV